MHIPVLQNEVLQYLDPKPNENFIDCTIDGGGHSLAIIEKILPRGKLLGIDADEEIIRRLKFKIQKSKFKNNFILVCDNFSNLREIIKKEKFSRVSGILFDLGISSWHLEESGRGFSFLKKEPLDMRYNLQNPLTAEKILNFWSKSEIERILKDFGEESFSRRIANEIINFRKIRPIKTTLQLVEIIKSTTPVWYQRKKIHPATRTFQALRIAVNDELNNLEKALPQALEILKPGGRLVVISFHSLEDRVVKHFFQKHSSGRICPAPKTGGGVNIPRAEPAGRSEVALLTCQILTKKPITPTKKEIKINPRSRSSKLRAAMKI